MSKIMSFLRQEVPGEKTRLAAWRKKAAQFGDEAPTVARKVLRSGKPELHYAALLVLRAQGYEAEERGYGSKSVYRIKPPNSSAIEQIRPAHHFPDLEPSAKWIAGKRPAKSKATAPRKRRSRTMAALALHAISHSITGKAR
jgi:hypothetical protein